MRRFLELDAFRGLAITGMVIFHFFFDLSLLGIQPRDMFVGGWNIFQKSIASLFLLIVGMSLTISYARAVKKHKGPQLVMKYLRRGGLVFGVGLLITLVTYMVYPEQYIVFGILHMIGIAIMLSLLFIRFHHLNLLLGILFVYFGFVVKDMFVSTKLWLWLGLMYEGFVTLDYYPLLPWFGVVLIGMFLGKTLYPKGQRKHKIELPFQKELAWMGQRSLVIYLIHQPVMLGLMMLYLQTV